MGAINYKTNKILVTLATPYYYPDDDEINEEINYQKEENDYNMTREEAIDILIENNNYFLNDEINIINNEINNYNFEFYKVKIECGYYEGFSISIDFNYIYFDNTTERKQAQKELTKLKKLLIYLVNNTSLCVCFPGWCTKFLNHDDSIKAIKQSIKPERERLKTLKTEKTFDFKTLFNY